jgi:hypothetical protein
MSSEMRTDKNGKKLDSSAFCVLEKREKAGQFQNSPPQKSGKKLDSYVFR